ncbi:MAG: type II secretion system protein [Thermodesulfobacteriota bacterium]
MRSQKPEARSQKGFTLLEILIAITILSIGLLALAEMTVYVIKSNTFGNKVTDATVLAQDKLEELRNLSYTDAQLDDTDSNTADISTDIHSDTTLFTSPDHSDGYPNDATGQTVTISLSPQRVWNVASDTPASGTKTVTVIVGWNDSINHFVALSTIIRQ